MSNWIFEELCRRIVKGVLSPDSRITEEMLARSLDASRTPLREALRQLEDVGLIIRQRNRGIRIAPLRLDEVVEMTQIRERLEGLVASAATHRVADDQASTKKLHAIIAELERAKNAPNADALYLKLGRLFHTELEALSGLERVGRMLANIHLSLARYRHILAADQARAEDRTLEHRRILEAIESGNAEEAEKQMRLHIRKGLEVFKSGLKETLNEI